MRRQILLILALIMVSAIVLTFLAALAFFRADEVRLAQSRLSLYSRSLSDTLQRFDYLPFILARDPRISAALESGRAGVMNVPFADFAEKSGLEAIYLMDTMGEVVASSNFDQVPTFMGQNYGFRAYFRSALAGEQGRFFGVGATTGRPGYFYAQPVRSTASRVIGVLAVKLDMSEFQKSWEQSGDNVLVTDTNGVVVLATNSQWLYRAIVPLGAARRAALKDSRQFGDHDLAALDWAAEADRVLLDGRRFILASQPKAGLDWTVHFLQDERRVWERAGFATATVGSAIVILMLIATYLRSLRIQNALHRSQADQRRLIEANDALENAHGELKRSGQLAALGQLAASVTHELGQPISALKNYLSAGEASGEIARRETLPKVERVIERIENIARELRFFTRPEPVALARFDFHDALAGALELVDHDVKRTGCVVDQHLSEEPLHLQGNRFRIERVCVNLIRNALEAMDGSPYARLTITTEGRGDQMIFSVMDNGPGLRGMRIDDLREPFHTTKPSGSGMGLGLSIVAQIVNEHDGSLQARDGANGGAVMKVILPLDRGPNAGPNLPEGHSA